MDKTDKKRKDTMQTQRQPAQGMALPTPEELALMAARNPANQQGMQTMQPMQAAMPGVMGAQEHTGELESVEGAGIHYGRPESRITREMLKEVDKTLSKYRSGKKSLEERIISAQEWWKLRNWEQMRKQGVNGGSADKSNTAWLWNCIVGKHADAMDSYPEPAILPRMPDDKEEAKRLSDIVPVILKVNGFEEVYSDVAWQKLQEGTGAYGVYWDQEKLNGLGEISIRKVNLLNLFWEPGITDIQDSRNVFHVQLMDNDVLVEAYPQLKGKQLGSARMVSKYRFDDSVDVSNKSLVVDWYFHRRQNGRNVLHYVKYVGEEVLYATLDNPEGMERGLYDDGLYPFVLDPLFPVEGSPCGFGYIHVGKDTQKDIDLLSQAVVSNAALAAKPRYFAKLNGGINEEEFADTNKPFVHYAGQLTGDNMIPIAAPSLPGNVLNVLQMKVEELKFVTGNVDVNNGGTPSGVTAASAIAALKEDAGRSSKDSNKAAYRAYALLVTMVIERIRQFYDMPRQFRITGAAGQEEFVSYSNANLVPQPQGQDFGVDMGYRLPAFDIDVRAQRETSYTKAAQNELAIQLFQMGVFNPQMADQSMMLLDMMDFKGKEELRQKVQQMGTMAMMLQQIGSIAMQMAMQLGDRQSAMMIQQMVMQAGGQAMMPQQGGTFRMPEGEAEGASIKEEKHPYVERAEQRSQEATRPL